jgi:hypothetical protein
VQLGNGAEGGTNTTVVTSGNSGSTSGNAFDTVTGSPTFSTTQAMGGTLAYSFITAGAATWSLNWTTALGGSFATISGRVYIYCTSFTVAPLIARGRDGSANQVFRIVTDTSGHIVLRVGTGNTLVGTTTAAMSTNTWYRVEWTINVGTSSQVDVWFYAGDGTSAADHITSATANTGTGNIAELNYGIFTSTASVPQFYLDDLAVSNGAAPGPARISGSAGSGAGTGAVTAAAPADSPNAGAGSGTGASNTPAAAVAPPVGNAAGSGAGAAAKPTVAPNAGLASGTGAANSATTAVASTAGSGAGVGSAPTPVPIGGFVCRGRDWRWCE